jgi:hypothetical protein
MKSSRLARQSHASEESLRVKLPILVEIGGSWRKQVGPFYKSARLKGPEEVAYPYLPACRKVSSSSPRPTASILVTPSTLLRISQSRIPTEYQTYACLMNLPHPFTVSSHIPSRDFGVTFGALDIGKADSYGGASDMRWKKLSGRISSCFGGGEGNISGRTDTWGPHRDLSGPMVSLRTPASR